MFAYAQENNTTADPCATMSCDDGNACTIDSCSSGTCSHPNQPDGTLCPDGDCRTGVCTAIVPTEGTVCSSVTCSSGENLNCLTNSTGACACPQCPTPGVVCGNRICESGEDSGNCPGDCTATAVCGNNICESGENTDNCSSDCRPAYTNAISSTTSTVCGNGVCEDRESETCSVDCGRVEPEQVDLRSQVSASVSGTSQELAEKLMDDVESLVEKAKAFDSSPSSDTMYALAYASTVMESKTRGYSNSYSSSDIDAANRYVIVYGPGRADLWTDEFGEVNVGGLWAYESTSASGVNVRFQSWYNDYDGTTQVNLRAEFSRSITTTYAETIKRARRDAEDEARKMEVAGVLADYLASFTISSDNEEIARDIVSSIEELYNAVKAMQLTKDGIYKVIYDSELLKAKLDGIGQSLECDALNEISKYIILYAPGTADMHQDEFGEQQLGDWKEIYKDDNRGIRLNFNKWGCRDFEEQGGMSIDFQLGKELTAQFRETISKARKDSQTEADALRRHALVLEARKMYSFDLEVEEVGDEIISALKDFKDKILAFEAGEITAYDIQYASVILRSKTEGIGEARKDIAEQVGQYVILYGPGIPDVWRDFESDELNVGQNLRIHESEALKFEFNRWFDEFQGRGGFNTWVNWGKTKQQYTEEIKRAEKDAWREAEIMRKDALASKMRSELESSVDETTKQYVESVKGFISLVRRYRLGEVSAYDVELSRLQVSSMMSDISKDSRDYLLVSDLGSDILPPDIWLNWESEEIQIGGWRELITDSNNTRMRTIASMDGWCPGLDEFYSGAENFECRLELRMNWDDWKAIKSDLKRANDYFWKQKRESEIKDKLSELIAGKSAYSSGDQTIIDELVSLINAVGTKADSLDSSSVEDFQYVMLLESDTINDKLDEASDESAILIAGAQATGFHDYDNWNNKLFGVSVYSDEAVEVTIRFHESFQNFFISEEETDNKGDYEVFIDVIWKEWSSELKTLIERAYTRYEAEQSGKRFATLSEKRTEVISELSEETITEKVNAYENGEMSMAELRNAINSLYYKLQGYDSELAYLAGISKNTFPDFEPLNIEVTTDHVKLRLYEKNFQYRFGAEVGAQATRQALENVLQGTRDIEFAPVDVERQVTVTQMKEGVEIDDEGNLVTGNQVYPDNNLENPDEREQQPKDMQTDERFTGEAVDEMKVNLYSDDEVADFVEKEKMKEYQDKRMNVEEFQNNEKEFYSDSKVITRMKNEGARNANIRINALKPKLSLSVSMTDTEIMNLAEEVKRKWTEMESSGLIDDALYSLNMGLDNMPEIQEAIRQWGDTTASVKLTYKEESIFELSFRTEEGSVAWITYGVAENAGNSSENVYLEIDFESVMNLRNWWEDRMKNAEGIMSIISSVPTFAVKMVGMMASGEINLRPFGTISKIPKFIQIFFGAMAPAAGADI